jgi:hypothetical protein
MGVLSPEAPLLKAADELKSGSDDVLELLPIASVDLKFSCEPDDKDCDVESSHGSASSTGAPRTESAQSEHSRDILEANGVSEMEVSQLMCNGMSAPCAATIQPMLCLMRRERNGVTMVIPCIGNTAHAEGEHHVFWCHVQPQQDGSMAISPCTKADSCGIATDAGGSPLRISDGSTDAEKKASHESSAPTWVFGPRWPFCAAPTTLMLSSLPDDLCQEDFIELLDKDDFSGFYDFVCLPTEVGSDRNLSYAIVNCTRHEHALSLAAKMQGKTSWGASRSSRECQVSWSLPLQGVSELIEHYRYHPSNSENVPSEKRPAYFSEGWPAEFPQWKCDARESRWW